MGEPVEWARSDAWVFAAVAGRAPCTLGEVVATGDGLNHAIFTGAELEQGIRRLLGAGLILTPERRFELTESGRDLAAARRGGGVRQIDHLVTALRRLPVAEQDWSLEPGELAAAVRWWQKRAARISR